MFGPAVKSSEFESEKQHYFFLEFLLQNAIWRCWRQRQDSKDPPRVLLANPTLMTSRNGAEVTLEPGDDAPCVSLLVLRRTKGCLLVGHYEKCAFAKDRRHP